MHWRNFKIFFSRNNEPISTKLRTKHSWVKGIQVCSHKGPHLYRRKNLKIVTYRTAWPISTKPGTKHPWVKGIQVCSNEGSRPFPRGDNFEIVKMHWWHLKIFASRTTGQISIKLDTKHSCMKLLRGFKFLQWYAMFFIMGDNYNIVKIHWWHLIIFFSINARTISTNLG